MDRIQRRLHAHLTECGWRDAMMDRAKEIIRKKEDKKEGGLANVTIDELLAELIPAGRAMVPAEARGEAMERVMAVLGSNGGGGGGSGGRSDGGAAGAPPS